MRKRQLFPAISAALLILIPGALQASGKLMQLGSLSAIVAGVYDGEFDMEIIQKPDAYGIGTFDRLDGEMVVLGGVVYQVSGDGSVNKPSVDMKIPFSCVSVLENPEIDETVENIDGKAAFDKMLREKLSSQNFPVLVVVTGDFEMMKTRSVPAQQKPYRPLADVAAEQAEFELGAQRGTLVGFYCPSYMAGLNAGDFVHLHFLNDDHNAGGHVLDFKLTNARLRAQVLTNVQVLLPKEDSAFAESDIAPAKPVEKVKGE